MALQHTKAINSYYSNSHSMALVKSIDISMNYHISSIKVGNGLTRRRLRFR